MFGCGIHKVSSRESGNHRETFYNKKDLRFKRTVFSLFIMGPLLRDQEDQRRGSDTFYVHVFQNGNFQTVENFLVLPKIFIIHMVQWVINKNKSEYKDSTICEIQYHPAKRILCPQDIFLVVDSPYKGRFFGNTRFQPQISVDGGHVSLMENYYALFHLKAFTGNKKLL